MIWHSNNLDTTLKSVNYADSKQCNKRNESTNSSKPKQNQTSVTPASFMLLHNTAGNHRTQTLILDLKLNFFL